MKRIACLFAILLASTAYAYIDKTRVGWDQHVGSSLPLNLHFTDTRGQHVQLADQFNGRPVALAFVYLSCPELCPEVLAGVQQAFHQAGLKANQDYDFVAVSIDPRDTPADAASRLEHLPLRNVHLLTTSTQNAAALARAAGFRYVYDDEHKQFAHPAGFLVATPQGKISRYFFGVRYDANELRAAVQNAQGGGVSTLVHQILLVCFHFDPAQGPYNRTIMTTLRAISIAMLALAGLLIAMHVRRHRRI